ncbi:MAG: hypothetical protein AABX37_00805 [Nanoarchaeota archaeon]
MVSYNSPSETGYASPSSSGYAGSSSSSHSSSSSSSIYTIKVKFICCGSFSRGQRCTGCPGG